MKLFLALVIPALIIALILTLLALNAPEGFEDSDGFHYGRKDK